MLLLLALMCPLANATGWIGVVATIAYAANATQPGNINHCTMTQNLNGFWRGRSEILGQVTGNMPGGSSNLRSLPN